MPSSNILPFPPTTTTTKTRQMLVKLPALSALAASQLHGCISSHFAGKGFQQLRRLALHTIEPDACTCLAAQVAHVAQAGQLAEAVAPAAPVVQLAAPAAAAPVAVIVAGHQHQLEVAAAAHAAQLQAPGQLHAQIQHMLQHQLLQHAPPHAPAAPAPAAQEPPLAPLVERVGLLVALCPQLQQLSIGRGSAAVLRAVERHGALQQLVLYGQTQAESAASAVSAALASRGRNNGAAGHHHQHDLWQPAQPGAAPPPPAVAAIEGHAWGLLRRGLSRLNRVTLVKSDVLLGGSPSPAVPLLALTEGATIGELQLLQYSALSDEGLAVSVGLMHGVRTLALGGCTVSRRLHGGVGRMLQSLSAECDRISQLQAWPRTLTTVARQNTTTAPSA
jgi:hypothetical protein